jgi:hypothetical protein
VKSAVEILGANKAKEIAINAIYKAAKKIKKS